MNQRAPCISCFGLPKQKGNAGVFYFLVTSIFILSFDFFQLVVLIPKFPLFSRKKQPRPRARGYQPTGITYPPAPKLPHPEKTTEGVALFSIIPSRAGSPVHFSKNPAPLRKKRLAAHPLFSLSGSRPFIAAAAVPAASALRSLYQKATPRSPPTPAYMRGPSSSGSGCCSWAALSSSAHCA